MHHGIIAFLAMTCISLWSACSNLSDAQSLDTEFPSGTLDCSVFPSEYGPIPVDWDGIGGWSSIQYATVEGDNVTSIVTAVAGDTCHSGAFCSYACPPGYQKSQWPAAQGSEGQSVGGILCNEQNLLELTNPGMSNSLCMTGVSTLAVENQLSEDVSICRTDYPGTESETIPVTISPDGSNVLTVPNANDYYVYEGKPTSAQYYVNNPGVPVEEACIWNVDGSHEGNWAPTFLGTGMDVNGRTWLQVGTTAQNDPSNYEPLNMTLEVSGQTSGNCRLQDGMYCSGADYDDCNANSCLVEIYGPTSIILS